ncbi:response regulator, partial [bacterium]|nr:response regulator [bacterium]
ESMVSLPLRVGEIKAGVLNILSRDAGAFDRQEIDLLKELASDIAYGLSMLRTQKTIKQAHEEKEKLHAQLLHSQKMEAVGILAGGVAHDFNNMLTAIQVSADLVMMEYEQSHPARHELEEIHRIATHAADLSKQLLLFSRKHPMEFIPMNINHSVDNLRKMLRRLIGERIEIETRLKEDLWSVRGDKGTIEQVLMNLAINARDAMPKGGKLLIQTQNTKLGKAEARRMPEARQGQFVHLRVEDTGHGMTPDVIQHIFEPFFSTKGPGKGTGLGLSVVYGIIKEHEGWITCKSREGKGTSFDIYIPAMEILEGPDARQAVHPRRLAGKGERILFVEDDERVRENSVKGLIKYSYKVHPARNIAEALRIFDRENGRFDLFFCDMALPDGNGLDLAETLKKKAPSLHVIVSSGYGDTRENALSRKDRGIFFLKKPFALKDLLSTIQEALT